MTGAIIAAGTGALVVATATPAAAAPGGSVILQPGTQSDTTGTQAALVAAVLFNNGTPVVGGAVNFIVITGPDAGLTFTGYTDSSGDASWTFIGNTAGTDVVNALWTNQTGTVDTGSATVTWVAPPPPPPPPPPPSINTSGPTNGATYFYGTVPAIFYTCTSNDGTNITLCDGTDPTYGDVPSGTQDGASTGVAPGNYSITITADDSNGTTATDNVSYTVVPAPTTLTYTGATTARWDNSFTASGQLTDNVNGNPVTNTSVNFSLGGTDSCNATTNGSGVASCSIHVTLASGPWPANANYPVSDTFGGNSFYGASSGGATFTVTHQLDSLSYTGDTTARYDDPFTASGVLTDTGNNTPVAGRSVTFTLGGTNTCTATTNGSGVASCTILVSLASGPWPASVNYPITDTFAGDDFFESAAGGTTFTVTHQLDTLTYTGATEVANGYPATLSGTLIETGKLGNKPIAGRTISFALGSGATAQACTGVTNAAGSASCTLANVQQPDSPPAFTPPVAAVFSGDDYFVPATASRTVDLLYYTGRSFGISVGGLLAALPDTGSITTAQWVSPAATVANLNLVNTVVANVLSASVTTGHKISVATGGVAGAAIAIVVPGVLGIPVVLPAITVGPLNAQSATTCAGSTGSSVVSSLTIGGVSYPIQTTPNYTISVLGLLTIVINQQIPVPGGLTVNALSITSPLGVSIVLGSATSDIHNCT